MKKFFRFFPLFVLAVVLFFQISFVSAQEGEEVVMSDTRYAAVSVSDAIALVFVDKSGFSVSANVKNVFPEKRAFQVGIEFRGISEENKGDVFIWRQPEEFLLEGNTEQSLSFVVPNPTHLAGKYRLTLGMNDRYGNVVAMVSLGEKEFSPAGRVTLKNCAFMGEGGGIIQLAQPAGVFGTCEVVWDGAEDGLVRVMTQVAGTRYGMPKMVGQSDTIMKPEATTLGNAVMAESLEPGVYQLEVVPVATGGYPVGLPIKKTLVVPGKGGKLKGVTRFEEGKSFASKEKVAVTAQFDLYDDGKYDLLLELVSQGVSCATPIRASVEGQPNMHEGEFAVTANCAMPEVRATLSSEGKQIDQLANGNNDMPMQEEKDTEMMTGMPQWMLWGGAGVLSMLLLYVLTKRRARISSGMMPVFFLLFATSLFFGLGAKQAEAGSANFFHWYICGGSCPVATTIWSNYDTNKDVYAPGETIQVDMRIGSDDNPQGACIGPVARLGLNGAAGPDLVPDCYSPQDIRGDLSFNFTINAPVATGPFNLTVTSGMSGYGTPSSPIHIPLTVAVASPAPTVTLSVFSPATITAGQSATISLSTNNATSCSGDAGSLWTDNLGGTSFSDQSTGPMSAGTYTQRVTCTGPGGSASSATQTLTVNAAPVASGSFTTTYPCTIYAPTNGCSTSLNWTSSNTSTVVLTNCGGVTLYTGGTGNQSVGGIWVPYNSGCYQIRNGSAGGPILDQTTISSSCESGTTWNGSSCNSPTVVASFTSGPPCVIASGQAGCNTTLSWTASNVSTLSLTNCQSSALGGSNDVLLTSIRNSGPGSFGGVYVPYNAGCYRLHEGGVTGPILDQIIVSSSCTSGTAYNGLNEGGVWHSGVCAPTTGIPFAQITANGPVAFESQTWWQKAFSWIMGKGNIAHATGSPANITVGQNARISWTSLNITSGCTVTQDGVGTPLSTAPSGNRTVTGVFATTLTFRISCDNGTVTDSAQVIVSGGGSPGVVCGNGSIESGEQCDNGLNNGACPALCSATCTSNVGFCASGPACAATHNNCITGISGNATSDVTTWYWECSASGQTRSCSEAKPACTDPVWTPYQTPCAGIAGQYGIPGDQIYGTANMEMRSCDSASRYVGGCQSTPICTEAPYRTETCSNVAGTVVGSTYIPPDHTAGTGVWTRNTCTGLYTYNNGCSVPACWLYGPWSIACGEVAGQYGIPARNTVGTAWIQGNTCGSTYLGGCSATSGPQYTITLSANPGGGFTESQGQPIVNNVITVWQGTTVYLNFRPDPGYVVDTVTVDGMDRTFNSLNQVRQSHTFQDVRANHVVAVTFRPGNATASFTLGTCTIPNGASTCIAQISWVSTDTTNMYTPTSVKQNGVHFSSREAYTVNRPIRHSAVGGSTFTFEYGTAILATETVGATCSTGAWNGTMCDVSGPTVDLKINGADNNPAVTVGDNLNITWTVNGATNCSSAGPSWAEIIPPSNGSNNSVPVVGGTNTYTLTCSDGTGANTSDSVTVTPSCVATTSDWSACGPPCSGGNGKRTRTVMTAACVGTTEEESCTTTVCRDLNWKEVGQ